MMKPIRRRHRSREEIAAYLAAFDRSGHSAVAFARIHKLALSTFRLWLSRRGKLRGAGASVGNGTALIPVTITGSDFTSAAMFEVSLINGRVLRFPPGLRPGDIAAISEALERPCSR